MNKLLGQKSWLVAVSSTLLLSTSLFGITGCTDDTRVRGSSVTHSPAYYDSDFFYYPSSRIYFHISSSSYYYRDGANWRHVKRLPPRVKLNGHRVRIKANRNRPYVRNHEHSRRYSQPRRNYRPNVRATTPPDVRNNERRSNRGTRNGRRYIPNRHERRYEDRRR